MNLKECNLCEELSAYRTQVVCGRGNVKSNVFVCGEAPGKTEDSKGIPFIGYSGSILNKYLKTAGLSRKDVFISNAVKCFPPKRKGSAKPTNDEIKNCNKWLVKEIGIVNPKIILAFGTTAMQALTGIKEGITSKIGTIEHYEHIPVFITLHPAATLHSPGRKMQFANSAIALKNYMKENKIYA